MSSIMYQWGSYPAPIVLTAGQGIAIYSRDDVDVYLTQGYPNIPASVTKIGTVKNTQTVFGPYASGARITLEGGAADVFYEVGISPQVKDLYRRYFQADPVALNATGAVTAAMIMNGIVTSTTAAAVAGTVPTGTVMDASSTWSVDEYTDWSVQATGANAFTVTAAAAGHTLVGTGVVAAGATGRFRTRKTAANTFVTYRLA